MTDNDTEDEIQAKELNAPRVTLADIEASITSEHYIHPALPYVNGDTISTVENKDDDGSIYNALYCLTICILVLGNGFTVTGESACVSVDNFDAELGRKIARQNAINKCWPLFGYALADAMSLERTE
jgi:hypothetical protein